MYKFGAIEEISAEDFHTQFNTNVLGLLLTTQGAVKNFSENGGSIINIGSAVSDLNPVGKFDLYSYQKCGGCNYPGIGKRTWVQEKSA